MGEGLLTEAEWVELIAGRLRAKSLGAPLEVVTGLKLAYGNEIDSYGPVPDSRTSSFQTDLAIREVIDGNRWKPRVVVEAKLGGVTTHDAITYGHKASIHRAVHPYLRYGIALGNRKQYPLPGRLYRHGAQFDFMISIKGFQPTKDELAAFVDVIRCEVEASRTLEKILYESRSPLRDRYTFLHRKLIVR